MSVAELQAVDSNAFDLRPPVGEANGAAALCLHGLTGTPYEVRPIAEALVATAMGLFAAIPAVIAYNRYADKVTRLEVRYDTFMEEFSSILQRHSRTQQGA